MSDLSGIYFDGISARQLAVKVSFYGDQLRLLGTEVNIVVPLAQAYLSPRLGRTRRQIFLDGGAMCELEDDTQLDDWFNENHHRRQNLLAKLEANWPIVAAAFAVVFLLAGSLAWWGFPWIAQRVASKVPQEWVDTLGKGALQALDESLGADTALSASRQMQLRKEFASLANAATVNAHFQFRNWHKIGPNAFALPDGTIVITDELVALADDDRELEAVIAHELGHVHERHALQQVIAGSSVAALIFVMTGDTSGLSHVVVAAPTILTQLHHSRTLENDADQFGFALLAREQIDPIWFARIIRKLEATSQEKHSSGKTAEKFSSDWLQTHPASEQRAQLAEKYLQDKAQ